MLTQEQKQEIANHLLGSCYISPILEEKYQVDDLDLAIAAEECGVYECGTCGWWVDDWNEKNGEVICEDCSEED